VLTVGIIGVLCMHGVYFSGRFLTGWEPDTNLRPVLTTAISASPRKAILGERPSPQRYELRNMVAPSQWNDTFAFSYAGLKGPQAYRKAIDQSHFGVIYLSLTTPYGRYVHSYLTKHDTPYQLVAKVPRHLRYDVIGDWFIYTPKVVNLAGQGELPPSSRP
jgi:hypothetical protein